MLRLTVQERLRRDGVDDLEVARTGVRNDETVMQAIRDTVDAYQRDADRGVGAPLSRPAETVARLARSLLEAGPLTKYFNDPTLADEVSINGDVITATGRDGRQTVDRGTDLRGRTDVDRGAACSPPTARPSTSPTPSWSIRSGTTRCAASVSIPPTARATRLHVPHLPSGPHLVRGSRRVELAVDPGGQLPDRLSVWPRPAACMPARPASGKSTLIAASLAATPPTTNVRIVQKYRELSTSQHTGGNWTAGVGRQGRARTHPVAAQLQPGPRRRRGGPRRRGVRADPRQRIRGAGS